MIIAESLFDKRDCTVAERSDRATVPSTLPGSSRLFYLSSSSSRWRAPPGLLLPRSFFQLDSFFSLSVFLSLSSTPLSFPFPLSRPHFLVASSFCLALGRSSSRFVTLFFIVERAQRLLRVDMITYGNSGGNITFLLRMPPRSCSSSDRERLAPL